MIAKLIVLAALTLQGVVGTDLRTRAFFDANNVRVGDPLVLTVDFLGDVEFVDIHPPALSRSVARRDWKVDDSSAKTATFQDGRRITYRVRPMREGVLWFPALEFEYADKTGGVRRARANAVPVHAKAGAQVVVAEMGEDVNAMPQPDGLLTDPGVKLGDDQSFAWRRACAKPTAEAFAEFDFPAAKLNEAACAIKAGNWSRAMQVYRRLEWQTGQSPAIERGLVAALALKFDNPQAELPVWRQVLRPLLRYDWRGRVGIVLGGFAAFALLFWLLSRGIRALACVAVALMLAGPAPAETVETVTTNADGSVTTRKVIRGGSGNMSFSFTTSSSTGGSGGAMPRINLQSRSMDPFSMFEEMDPFGDRRRSRQRRPPVKIDIDLQADRKTVTVGETFNLVLTVEHPRHVSIAEGLTLALAEQDLVKQAAPGYSLAAARSQNPTNVIQRLVFPMWATAPIDGTIHFAVTGRYTAGFGFGFFDQGTPFSSGNRTAALKVKPVPAAGRPGDFSGIVSSKLSLREHCDLVRVETNDVVNITYHLEPDGLVPRDFLPEGAAFESARGERRDSPIEYRRFFIADGAKATPRISISYYDTARKCYQRVSAGGTPLVYVKGDE